MTNKILLTLIIAFVINANAQKTERQNFNFSLQQAIEYAQKNNYKSINAGRDIESSKQKKWETTAIGLPQLNGKVDFLHNFNLQKQGVSGNAFNPMGSPDDIATIAFGTKNTMIATATLSQLIFDGSYIVALQASKAYLQFFENAKKKTDNDIKEMIINAYGNVLLAEASINILESNKTILEKNYNDINQIYKNGLGEQESVEQIAITLETVKSSLNNVTRLREISLKMLKINLGIEINDDLKLTDNLDDLSKSNLELALTKSEFNVENNIEYQIATSIVTQKRLLMKLEKSKALPSLGAAFNIGYNSFANDFNFLKTNQKWNNFSNVGVSLNVPIFSSFGHGAKVQQAKIAFEQAQTQQKEAEQMLKLGYEKAKSDFDFSIEQYATAKNNLSLAERIEKKQQIKFKEGLSTSFEFSEAQRQLYSAQQTYLQSMVDIINKKAALEKLVIK
ncbi:MAG: TolC family protein [Flavobacterium sp.]|nr:TolC family protein [Flavobacterium sp.]